jgi:hypothetical protein
MLQLARKAIRRPGYALTALGRQLQARPVEAPEGREYIADRLTALRNAFAGVSGEVRGKSFNHGGMKSPHAELLWSLVRERKPERVVETGVCNGLSTAVILEAMDRNGSGWLVSVDLPEFTDLTGSGDQWAGKGGAVIPAGKSPGWLVTKPLRWELVLGRSQDVLPGILSEGCDLFIHDGEHSYDCQLFGVGRVEPRRRSRRYRHQRIQGV